MSDPIANTSIVHQGEGITLEEQRLDPIQAEAGISMNGCASAGSQRNGNKPPKCQKRVLTTRSHCDLPQSISRKGKEVVLYNEARNDRV
jgi:hypothetical protein